MGSQLSSDDSCWTGKVVFYERWTDASEQVEVIQKIDLPGDLVFRDIPEYSLTDDLSGTPLDATVVTAAKHEEVKEMHRRAV